MILVQLPLGREGGWRELNQSRVYNETPTKIVGSPADVLGKWYVLIPQGRGHEKSLLGTLPDPTYESPHLAGSDLHLL